LSSPLKEGRSNINPVAHKAAENAAKVPSSIADTRIAVSATFSIGLANEASTSGQKEQTQVVEKKPEENKTANASFTFKLCDKKEESSSTVAVKAPSATPNFSALL
jgi:uncharacterized surface anchored protein